MWTLYGATFPNWNTDYPVETHDLHNDYPLACEKIKVTWDMLSKYQLQIIENNNFSISINNLISNLGNDKIHFQNLKLFLNLGLQLKNIYRIFTAGKIDHNFFQNFALKKTALVIQVLYVFWSIIGRQNCCDKTT